jgi:hypothetical protein
MTLDPNCRSAPSPSGRLQQSCAACAGFIWDNGSLCMVATAIVMAFSSFSVKMIHGRLSVFQVRLLSLLGRHALLGPNTVPRSMDVLTARFRH